ncbi:SHOCT domain-containing protein [Enterococcus faecalis]|uniref:SHOCT domain-containing protein n=1 Tax=Enterococcus TaxID=1350 RepID=UPI00100F35C6|nr:hypothetical protein CYQ27_02810 [Enterococcus faecalis]
MKSMCELCDLNPGKIITFDNHSICKHCAEHLELKPKEIKDRTMESIIKRQEEIIKKDQAMQAKGNLCYLCEEETGKYFTSDFYRVGKSCLKKLKVSTWSVDKKSLADLQQIQELINKQSEIAKANEKNAEVYGNLCALCQDNKGKYLTSDNYQICKKCAGQLGVQGQGYTQTWTLTDLRNVQEDNRLFNPTTTIAGSIEFDEPEKKFRLVGSSKILPVSIIADYKILEKKNTHFTEENVPYDRVSSVYILINLDDLQRPTITISFLKTLSEQTTEFDRQLAIDRARFNAERALSSLDTIVRRIKEKEIPTPIKSDKNQPIEAKLFDSQKNSSSAIEDVMAELRNLKLLVDEGILTEEEFQQKKRQLLQLD